MMKHCHGHLAKNLTLRDYRAAIRYYGVMERLKNLSISTKISSAIILTTLFATLIYFIANYHKYLQTVESQLGLRLQAIATTASLGIDPTDHKEIEELYLGGEKEIAGKEVFQRVQKYLRDVKVKNKLASDVYTVILPDWAPDKMIFITMGSEETYIGNGLDRNPYFVKALNEATHSPLYSDSEGNWLTGLAPIKNQAGQTVAILAVDYLADSEVLAAKNQVVGAALYPLTLSLFMAIFIGLFLGRRFARPVVELKKAADRVRDGDVSADVTTRSSDEIGVLGQAFNQMVSEIRQRRKESIEQLKEIGEQRDQANRANKAKTQFLANMSHEIRTPLNGMLGFVGLLQKTPLSASQTEQLGLVKSSGELLLSIISDILDFSKIDAGKMQSESIEFDLKDCVEKVAEVMAVGIWEKKLKFHVLVDERIPSRVIGDQGHLRQVLLNIIGNATKYTPTGEITLKLTQQSVSNDMSSILFEIEDTGMGISEENLKSIFSPFEQADNSDTRKYGGSGLGLSICTSLIKMMGGRLEAESVEAQGSRFFFTLDFEVVEHEQRKLSETRNLVLFSSDKALGQLLTGHVKAWGGSVEVSSGQSGEVRLDGGRWVFDAHSLDRLTEKPKVASLALLERGDAEKRAEKLKDFGIQVLSLPVKSGELFNWIDGAEQMELPARQTEKEQKVIKDKRLVLIVDDNLVNLKVAKAIMTSMGYDCRLAENGQAAVDEVMKYPFDLVLMDLQMPIMDGFQATQKIREQKPNLPVIAVTANAFKKVKEDAFDSGMNDFVTKPFTGELLEDVISRHLDTHGVIASDSEEGEEKVGDEILVVDDNLINRKVAVALLKSMGYSASAVESGKSAIEKVGTHQFGAILMDCQMPEMDGLEATREIKKSFPQLPIIALTGNAHSEAKAECYQAGMEGFLTKPINENELRQQLEEILAAGSSKMAA